jgi:hypothetical protein
MADKNLTNLLLKAGILDIDGFMRLHRGESFEELVESTREFRNRQDAQYFQEREDLTTPHTLQVEELACGLGTDIEEVEAHEQELATIVDRMKEELVNETKILEGTAIPDYASLLQNELSNGEQRQSNGGCSDGMASGQSSIYTPSETDSSIHSLLSNTST